MNIYKFATPVLAILLLSITACSDDEEATPANTAPVITITSPTDPELEAGFARGTTVTMVGSVEDDKEVATVAIDVFYGSFDLDLDETVQVNQKSYSLNHEVKIPESAPSGQYRIEITAVDNEGLPTMVEKNVRIN